MAVTYFVRMVAKAGQADNVLDLLLVNPRRIEEGEQGNIVFGVHRSIDNPNEFWLYEPELDTLEALLTAVPGPTRFIPTHTGQELQTSEIAALPTRSGSEKNTTYFPLTPQSLFALRRERSKGLENMVHLFPFL
jgi:Antibiotic biosynthesis monooxygenase